MTGNASQNYSADGDFRLAIIGDLHTHWDHVDLAQFSALNYDLLFFIGDLGGGTRESTLTVARNISRLQSPTLVMPGNNDTWDIDQLGAELAHQNGLNALMAMGSEDEASSNPVRLCGYTIHELRSSAKQVSLITGRPHSLGGPDLSFPDYMATTYGINSLEESTAKLIELVESSSGDDLLFVSHNGPRGLGENPDDMWGCDFKEGGGDWGDPDLQLAINHARSIGKNVLGVIGGHMHLRTKQGTIRSWHQELDDIQYINAATVPRIFSANNNVLRHHIEVTIGADGLSVQGKLLQEYPD